MTRFIITGTDTGIGKTVFAAALTGALQASYWKPIQAGLDEDTDSDIVRRLTSLAPGRILPEAYRLRTPASPHLSAERDGIRLDPDTLVVPHIDGPLIIEGAGGLLVPVTRQCLQIDLFRNWQAPLILCARTGLGTINHTLLSVEAIRARGLPLQGIAFIGEDPPDTVRTIADLSGVPVLGRLPWLEPLTPDTLAQAFAASFRREDFQ